MYFINLELDEEYKCHQRLMTLPIMFCAVHSFVLVVFLNQGIYYSCVRMPRFIRECHSLLISMCCESLVRILFTPVWVLCFVVFHTSHAF